MLNPMLVAGRSHEIAKAWGDPRTYKFMHLPIQSGHKDIGLCGWDGTLEEF